MGKASSSKKVARAARVGGSAKSSSGRKWGFPATIGAIVICGVGLVAGVRLSVDEEGRIQPRISEDHWHSAFAVYTCDSFRANVPDGVEDPHGIHTHADGLIHIHPFTSSGAGSNARIGVFADQVGITLNSDGFVLPGDEEFKNGDDCNGEPGVAQLLKWNPLEFDAEPQVILTDFDQVRFLANGEAYVLAFAPEGAEIPLPPSVENLSAPTDLAEGETAPDVSLPGDFVPTPFAPTTTTLNATPTTTIPGATTLAPTTTTPGETTTTPGATTPTTTTPGATTVAPTTILAPTTTGVTTETTDG